MDTEIVATIIQTGSQFISKVIDNMGASRYRLPPAKPPRFEPPEYPGTAPATETLQATPLPFTGETLAATPSEENKATGIKAGCIPCSIGHFGAANGMLAEALRFARKEGLSSPEAIDRIGEALDELNALERKDMTPAMLQALPEWERKLALETLATSRDVRHKLEGLATVNQLEEAAAEVETTRKSLGREWFKMKFQEVKAAKDAQEQSTTAAQ